jgi:hypothetical protein
MQRSMNWRYHLPEVFAPDDRPGADTQVYCRAADARSKDLLGIYRDARR